MKKLARTPKGHVIIYLYLLAMHFLIMTYAFWTAIVLFPTGLFIILRIVKLYETTPKATFPHSGGKNA